MMRNYTRPNIMNKVLFNRAFMGVLFFLSPFVDMTIYFTRALNISFPLNQILRLILYFAIVILIFINSKRGLKKWLAINLLLLFSLLVYFLFDFSTNLVLDINYVLRVSYCLSLFILIDEQFKLKYFDSEFLGNLIIYSSLIISCNILLSPLGIGNPSWSSDRFGYKGFFDGQNVITQALIIAIMICLALEKNKKKLLIFMPLSVIGLLLVGTRSGQIGVLFTIAMMFLYFAFFDSTLSSKIKKVIKFCSILAIFLLPVAIYFSSLYMMSIGNYDSFVSIILNYRNHMASLVYSHFLNHHLWEQVVFTIFGIGYSNIRTLLTSYKLTPTLELDFIASFFYSGIIITLYIIVINFKAIKNSLYIFIRSKDFSNWILLCGLILSNILAFINGHVLFETLVAPYFYGLLAICINQGEKNDKKIETKIETND